MEPLDSEPGMSSVQKKARLRPQWSNTLESKLALCASIVSPYEYHTMAAYFYYFGGGAIFLPLYLFFLAVLGVPILLLEVAVGQYTSKGVWCVWNNIAPLFKGIGYLVTFQNSQAAFLLFWTLMSHVIFCYDTGTAPADQQSVFSHCANRTEYAGSSTDYGGRSTDYGGITEYGNTSLDYDPYGFTPRCRAQSPYSKRWVDPWRGDGGPLYGYGFTLDGGQVIAMFVSILLVCGIVALGKRVLAAASAICVLIPLPLMFMLMIRTLTLPGAGHGLLFGFFPNVDRLRQNITTYTQPAMMALYTVGSTLGTTMTAASYNRFNNGFLLDCLLAVVYKLVTILILAITALAAAGALAHVRGEEFSDIFVGGPASVAMMTELLLMHTPAGGFWAACYLISLLLSSVIAAVWVVETVVMAVWDILPHTPRFRHLVKKHVLVGVFTVPWLLYSIGYCTKNSYMAVNRQSLVIWNPMVTTLLAFLQCAAVGWIFGARRFQMCWTSMQGRFCGCPYPLIFWSIVTPALLAVLLLLNLIETVTWSYDLIETFPVFLFSLMLIFYSAVFLLFTRPGFMRQKWRRMITPWDLLPHQLQNQHGRYAETFAMSQMVN